MYFCAHVYYAKEMVFIKTAVLLKKEINSLVLYMET